MKSIIYLSCFYLLLLLFSCEHKPDDAGTLPLLMDEYLIQRYWKSEDSVKMQTNFLYLSSSDISYTNIIYSTDSVQTNSGIYLINSDVFTNHQFRSGIINFGFLNYSNYSNGNQLIEITNSFKYEIHSYLTLILSSTNSNSTFSQTYIKNDPTE